MQIHRDFPPSLHWMTLAFDVTIVNLRWRHQAANYIARAHWVARYACDEITLINARREPRLNLILAFKVFPQNKNDRLSRSGWALDLFHPKLYMWLLPLLELLLCFQVETIGDAYLIVGGVPDRCKDHADRVIAMAFDMIDVCSTVTSPADNTPIAVTTQRS